MKLSLLIPTIPNRNQFMIRLYNVIQRNAHGFCVRDEVLVARGEHGTDLTKSYNADIELLIYQDNGYRSIGTKRNTLLDRASGDYVAFIDDDDMITESYMDSILEGIAKDVDCCSLKGIITEDGANPLVFEHSIKYNEYKTNPDEMPVRYERYPNHLNCIKASIAKQFKFPETNQGEDTDWATQIYNSGLIKTEHYIKDVIYLYDYRSKK